MVRPIEPQPVLEPLTASAIFMTLVVEPGGEDAARDLLTDVSALVRSVGFRYPDTRLSCVAGIGSQLWDRLYSGPRPAELHPFREIRGGVHTAVATGGDLLFHLKATRMDMCFELAGQLLDRLRPFARVIDEVHGFQYFDERDLLGFVDGTENPGGWTAYDAAVIGDEDADFVGGSYVIVQKYLHNLDAWNLLPVEQQEGVIGRTKLSDIELADDVKPTNSHVALNTIEEPDGTQRQIVRRNMPFGRIGSAEFGTYFIGYARTPAVTELMLQNMFVGKPVGNYDRILDFSTAVTGALFFIPSAQMLDNPPPARGTDVLTAVPTSDSSTPSPSTDLKIGNLRGRRNK